MATPKDLLAAAQTVLLGTRAVGHGLQAIEQRIEGIEQRAAELRALVEVLAAQPTRREPARAVPIRREAA